MSREGKIRGACLEIAVIINDWRAEILGGMETALMLWEKCCIPSVLHGAGTWVEMNSSTEKRLNSIQSWFVRFIYQVGQGSPVSALLWDNFLLDMGLRVYIEILMFVFHLRSLDSDSLAWRTYTEQKEKKLARIISGDYKDLSRVKNRRLQYN